MAGLILLGGIWAHRKIRDKREERREKKRQKHQKWYDQLQAEHDQLTLSRSVTAPEPVSTVATSTSNQQLLMVLMEHQHTAKSERRSSRESRRSSEIDEEEDEDDGPASWVRSVQKERHKSVTSRSS